MAAGKAGIPWAEAVDRNTGRKYWWHRETKETTWRNPIPKCIETKANQLFQQFDKDGGGSISTEELGGALGELDIRISENQPGLLLLRYDEDKSGELDCEEWMALVRDAVSAAASARRVSNRIAPSNDAMRPAREGARRRGAWQSHRAALEL